MKHKPIITIIGAASTTFGPKVLRDIINHPAIGGCTLRFVDINRRHLDIYTRLAEKINQKIDHPVKIESTVNRKKALPGSDFVLVSVETLHYGLWQQDFQIPVRLGSRQVTGELGGPGGAFHALRQIPVHLAIARDLESLCPRAIVMIMSNPLNRLCLAVRRHTRVGQIIGLCHGVEITVNFLIKNVVGLPGEDIEVTAAGTNHFTWILKMWHRRTGRDLYPVFNRKIKTFKGTLGYSGHNEALSRKLHEVFGYLPACGDGHIGEYLPFAYEFLGKKGPSFTANLANEKARWKYLGQVAAGKRAFDTYTRKERSAEELLLDDFFKPRSWVDTLAFPVIAAMVSNKIVRMPALNMVNNGAITNLPADVFVETPAVADASGIRAEHIGALPKELAAFNRRDIDQTELVVEAGVKGDRRLLLKALLLDPVCDSVRATERIIDTMLKKQARYLPQFK